MPLSSLNRVKNLLERSEGGLSVNNIQGFSCPNPLARRSMVEGSKRVCERKTEGVRQRKK